MRREPRARAHVHEPGDARRRSDLQESEVGLADFPPAGREDRADGTAAHDLVVFGRDRRIDAIGIPDDRECAAGPVPVSRAEEIRDSDPAVALDHLDAVAAEALRDPLAVEQLALVRRRRAAGVWA